MFLPPSDTVSAYDLNWPTTNVPSQGWAYLNSFDDTGISDTTRSPGPLTSALIAMLGNSSWFGAAAALNASDPTVVSAANNATLVALCVDGTRPLPLARLEQVLTYEQLTTGPFSMGLQWCADSAQLALESDDATDVPFLVAREVANWFRALNTSAGWNAMELAMYFANEAAMVGAAEAGYYSETGITRIIYSAAGTEVTKPTVSLPAKIVVSVLVGAEVVILLGLAVYIFYTPTLSRKLDATTMLVVGANLREAIGEDMPQLGLVDRKAMERLEGVDVRSAFEDKQARRLGEDTDGDIELADRPAPDYEPRAAAGSEDTVVERREAPSGQ
jgi:hypothetical protein